MARQPENWLKRPNVTWRWALICVFLWTVALLVLDQSQIADDLETKVSRPLDFRMREALGRSPQLDPRIKVFAIDDNTVAWLGSLAPSTQQWAEVILALARRKPSAIIIDSMFSMIKIEAGDAKTEAKVQEIIRLGVPVIVGSFIAPVELPFRKPLDLSAATFDLRGLLEPGVPEGALAALSFAKAPSSFVYGPHPTLRDLLGRTGHIHYAGDGRAIPYYKLDNNRGIPHFVLLMDPLPTVRVDGLRVRGNAVFLYPDGSIPLNFNSYASYLKVTKRLGSVFVKAAKGEPVTEVNEGDTVYIMPAFYTANTDFKPTPFGLMPAGYAHLALINSILTGQWLHPLWAKEILILVAAFIGAGLGMLGGPVLVGLGFCLGTCLWVGFSLAVFAFYGFMLPWILPAVSYVGALVSVFVEKSRVAEKKAQFIRQAFDGVTSPKAVNAIAKNPEQFDFAARERFVTIMFSDVVGFSLMAENQLPHVAFDQVRAIMGDMIEIVHAHGGIVNKNFGDGLLCFFGYSLETDESTFDHAEKAFECAIAIQRANLAKTIMAFERAEPVYPLRIGLNTSAVLLGNIGTQERFDFTIIGNGVNFAKRLEAACESHCILMSTTTKELIDPIGALKTGMVKKSVQTKHHAESVEAYSYDPFHDQQGLRESAMKAFVQSTNAARLDEHWEVRERGSIKVLTQIGAGELIRFSTSVLSVHLPTLLTSETVVHVVLDNSGGQLRQELVEAGFAALETEVTFTYEDETGAVHGLKIKNLSDEATSNFIAILKRHAAASQDAAAKIAS